MLSLIVVLVISVGVIVASQLSTASSHIERTGKISHTNYWEWWEPNKPSVTIVSFEGGDVLYFVGMIENIEVGKTYRIVYHRIREDFIGEWSGEYYTVDSIEEVKLDQ